MSAQRCRQRRHPTIECACLPQLTWRMPNLQFQSIFMLKEQRAKAKAMQQAERSHATKQWSHATEQEEASVLELATQASKHNDTSHMRTARKSSSLG